MQGCPVENELMGFLDGRLGSEATASLQEHIDRCPACFELFAALGGAEGPGMVPPVALQETIAAPGVLKTSTADLPRIAFDLCGVARAETEPGRAPVDFEILRTLGEGGMGRVMLALQRSLGREVAIKTLKENASPLDAGALLHEARITGALEHPVIIPVHALGLDESGKPVLVMKRVEGVSLRVLLDQPSHPGWNTIAEGRTDRLDACLEILMRVCQALAFGHSRGIIHRDIKPANVMIGPYGEVYLLDWGVAATSEEAARAGAPLVGTPAYMAPEMALGDPIDARTDVYLLGATLHEMLTGRVRHEGASMQEVLRAAALSAKVEYEPGVAPELADLCNRATSREPAERPSGADAFRRELAFYIRKRSAMALCDAALTRTVALEAKLAAVPERGVPADVAAAYRLATEARFGFVESLKEAPSLAQARRGFERCLRASIDLELRQGHVESASALLDELEAKPPSLIAEIADARERVARAHEDVERLRAIEQDRDPSVSAQHRTRGLLLLVVVLCVLGAGMTLVPRAMEGVTVPRLVYLATMMTGGCLVVVGGLRRYLFANLWNRQVTAVVILNFVVLLIHRLLSLWQGLSVTTVIGNDLLLIATMFAVAAALMLRGFWFPALFVLVMRVFFGAFSRYGGQIFSLALIGCILLVMWVLNSRVAETRAPDNGGKKS